MASAFITVQIKKRNMPQTKRIVSVENVVSSVDVNKKTDFNKITRTFPDVEYHPEQFSGLFHRILDPKILIL